MFDSNSRYYKLEIASLAVTGSDGKPSELRYVRRRFLPDPASDVETLAEHIVVDGDRLDNVTARYLDDPLQFWRLCDANNPMHPNELADEAGERIKIALPKL